MTLLPFGGSVFFVDRIICYLNEILYTKSYDSLKKEYIFEAKFNKKIKYWIRVEVNVTISGVYKFIII